MMKHLFQYIAGLLLIATMAGCKKYLDVPLPINQVAGSAAFQNDYTSAAAINSVYTFLYTQGDFDGNSGVGFLTGMYGDELKNFSTLPANQALYASNVSSTIGGVTGIWSSLYTQ